MTRIDWIILGFVAFTALAGLRQGLLRSLLSLAGLAVGAVVGARIGEHVLAGGGSSRYTALAGLAGALVGASVLHGAASWVGGKLRGTLWLAPPLRLLDSVGGLAAGAAWGLALAWVAGAVAVQIPGHAQWHRDARQSHVLRRLNELAPPRDVLKLRDTLPTSLAELTAQR
jgi:hypothetical protein